MNARHLAITVFSTITALVLGSTGCASDDADGDEASATTTSALQAQSQDGVVDGVLDTPESTAPDPEVVAQHVVDYQARGLSPAECVKKSRNGSVVTMTLDDCTGPLGQVVIKGSLVATFSKTSSSDLHVEIAASDGTTTNGHPLSYAAQADVHFDGSKRVVTYQGHSSGTTKRGKDFSRQTTLTLVADVATHCAKLDGTSKGAVGKYEVDLSISGFEACRDACPTAGVARATVDGPLVKDASVEVTFDGSPQAHAKISARKTRELDVALDCNATEAAD